MPRTTLTLDDRAFAVARAKARSDGTSLGEAVSGLILDAVARPTRVEFGFPMFQPTADHVITDDLVATHRDDG